MKGTIALLIVWAVAAGSSRAGPVDYDRDVKPVLDKHCYSCHGAHKQRSGLRLDGVSYMRQGGDRGPAIAPGAAPDSLLVQAIAGAGSDVPPMPPRGDRLTPEEIATIRAWVEQGAGGAHQETAPAARPRSDHWAFQPIGRPALPSVKGTDWIRNPIDRFILAKLEVTGIIPAAEADRATLLRRLTLDLSGVPPTVTDVDAFLSDARPGAYERCVDRVLASPAYGERWGRHWLDAACFADSGGYESDFPRSLWMYRDWVVDALNHDLAFDEFVVAQLAGDLRPGAGFAEKVPTGFLCTAMYDGTLGQGENARLKMAVDRVNMIGTVFLGLTLGCAQCHSHKFDPISQREYYQFFAFINDIDDGRQELERASPEEFSRRDAVRAQITALEQELSVYERTAEARLPAWEASLTAESRAKLAAAVIAALAIAPAQRSEVQMTMIRAAFLEQDSGHQQRKETIKNLRDREPVFPKTHVAVDVATRRTTHIFRRGEFSDPGDAVVADIPSVLPPLWGTSRNPPQAKVTSLGEGGSGRPTRMDLARWIASPENPLTARVMVNRVWLRYFGVGLVATDDNLGLSGEPPSHPELLDWLASEFMARGWSLKALHRLIVTSTAYRQTSRVRPELAEIDPQNRLLARQTRLRLEAEAIRDNALAVSGLLSHKVGGPSVFPYQPTGILAGRATKADWVMSPGEDRYRRGMYTYFWRLTPHPFLRLFDAPDANAACTRRTRSNTPLQALTLLNDPMFVECAEALADRLLRVAPSDDAERIRLAYRLCLGRPPSRSEFAKVERFLAESRGADGPRRTEWVALARAMMNLDEFLTKE